MNSLEDSAGPYAGLTKRRVEALTDGIFGTVMTVLGLSLSVPFLGPAALGERLGTQQLGPLLEELLVYALGFVFLGVYWVGHHYAFEFLRHTDRTFIWLNNIFLMFIGLLPLTTALIGRYFLEQLPLIFYGLNQIAISLSLYATFRHATKDRHLREDIPYERVVRIGTQRILSGPVIASVSIGFSFVDPIISLLLFVAVPVAYALPSRIDIFFRAARKA